MSIETRGRPKSPTIQNRILASAIRLFTEQGFSKTTIAQVSGDAGIAKQTVYSYFESKDDLFRAAIQAKCEQFAVSMELTSAQKCPRESLTELAENYMALVLSAEARGVYRNCISEVERKPLVSRLFFECGYQRVLAGATRVMALLGDAGHLDILKPKIAAIQFLQMVQGEAKLRSELGIEPSWSQQQVSEYINCCVDLFIKGYTNTSIGR
ncbi:TetR/AcrR family transcriptional regulator [Pontibacterium sp.]|uniref:TetR/AcrR family transcriptional regulator n=1 Tax=Pontibacterium sp. TaxID=2036026 RepID=UPI003514A58E